MVAPPSVGILLSSYGAARALSACARLGHELCVVGTTAADVGMVSGAGKGKAGPPRREDTGTPGSTPKIVTRCNTLNNPRTCRKWAFYSRRVCALIPTGGEWGTLGWWRPPSYEGRRGLALQHT